jgi:hypothetical protein
MAGSYIHNNVHGANALSSFGGAELEGKNVAVCRAERFG